MGFDLAKDLVDQWWTNAYNESLNRVNIEMKATVEKNKEPYEKLVVSMSNEGEQDDGIPPSAKIRKRMLKSNFTEFSKVCFCPNIWNLISKMSQIVLCIQKRLKTRFAFRNPSPSHKNCPLSKMCAHSARKDVALLSLKSTAKRGWRDAFRPIPTQSCKNESAVNRV